MLKMFKLKWNNLQKEITTKQVCDIIINSQSHFLISVSVQRWHL